MHAAPQTDRPRIAGILIPVFAIRTENDLGIGDTGSVRELIDWAAEIGMGFLQFLPINEMGGDCSPYNAISSCAIEPLTLETSPRAIPELSQEAYDTAVKAIDPLLLQGELVHYAEIRQLKNNLLHSAFESFRQKHLHQKTAREDAFVAFCAKEQNWLRDYSIYRLLMDRQTGAGSECWEYWPAEYNTMEKAREFLRTLFQSEGELTEHQLAYYSYVQFIAYEQWNAIAAYAETKGVQLMGDVPFGINRNSADVFAHPEIFDLEWCGGAPPETNFKDDEFTMRWGQNWGIPLYRWDVMAQNDNYAWWRQRIGKLCEVFKLFRIDHALGFYRIYSFPFPPQRNDEFLPLSPDEARERLGGKFPGFKPAPDDTPENQANNLACGERYLKVIQEAAGDSAIVAEDLGTVPPYVPDSLARLEIPGMKVPMWDTNRENGEFMSADSYPYVSLATFATHDHEPIRMQWEHQRAVIQNGGPHWEIDAARYFLHRFGRWAQYGPAQQDPVPAFDDHVREALLGALFRSTSKYASVMVTDLLGLEDRFNVPGVRSDANWRVRLRMTVKELRQNGSWVELGKRIRHLLADAGRQLP